ncbi:MAG TPA: DNA polymerase IV [Caulobacteraceae bacterium]|jgi:DNA polymerase-4|nr:DNA polymerase IV [Caulobacteraceae bacterium]
MERASATRQRVCADREADYGRRAVTETSLRKIIHVDMDAFYASVEQRDDPSLRGRPVAVGGLGPRGVVAAASYEARRFGVRSAMASMTARARCAELVFVRPRFEVYRSASRQIHAIFADYADAIEPLSLDEAYLDVTANRAGLPSASATAEAIRARIFTETGLTASAGVSYNKFLAKLASDENKPNGQFVVTPQMGPRFVESLPVSRFHGVGPVTARKMQALGIVTGADLRAWSLDDLTARFGKAGGWYYRIARAQDDRPVSTWRRRKSSGSETTFAEDLFEADALEAAVAGQAQDVWTWCARNQAFGRTVTVKVKYADFRIVTRSRTLARLVDTDAALHTAARELIRGLFPVERGVRLVGVTVSHFPDESSAALPEQLDLALA